MVIQTACREHANAIARLIMQAMNYDCCRYYAGPEHSLEDFERMMTRLVEAENSQYSYTNTHVALDDDGSVAGICVTYDGARLHELREAFIKAAREFFGRDYSTIGDETSPGELYIDSLAVDVKHRGRGIAGELLRVAIAKAAAMGIPAGLLVDKGNPLAERLYVRTGFKHVGDTVWGGHPMKHLQYHHRSKKT